MPLSRDEKDSADLSATHADTSVDSIDLREEVDHAVPEGGYGW